MPILKANVHYTLWTKYGHCALALVLLKLAYLPQRVYVQHTSKTKHSEEALWNFINVSFLSSCLLALASGHLQRLSIIGQVINGANVFLKSHCVYTVDCWLFVVRNYLWINRWILMRFQNKASPIVINVFWTQVRKVSLINLNFCMTQ